jgi:Pyrimidine dimer DNA glycosylase
VNIFYLDRDPYNAAQMMVDRHVVKMILETCQLLSTTHRILDGTKVTYDKYVNGSLPPRYRKATKWVLPDNRENILYSATHINHPSAVWVRQSNNNYNWLYAHFLALLNEYTFRYGKSHKCESMIDVLKTPPHNIPVDYFTQPTCAMDKQYIISTDSVTNYRNYYKHGKSHLHKYTKRNPPDWLSEG